MALGLWIFWSVIYIFKEQDTVANWFRHFKDANYAYNIVPKAEERRRLCKL